VSQAETAELVLRTTPRRIELAARLGVEPHEEQRLVVVSRRRDERLVDHLHVEQPP
jgi:hypothetical protein